MRRLSCFLALVATVAPSSLANGQVPLATVRVLTYNVHHGEGVDGQFDLARLAAVITEAAADLVAIQEIDERTQRSGGVSQVTELARLTGLEPIFGEAMPFQGGGYGVAILSRWPVVAFKNQPLPGTPDREPRTVLSVTVRPSPTTPPIVFSTTHLDFGRSDGRNAQALALNQLLAGDDHTLSILGGDLNSGEDSDVLQILRTRWREVVVPGATSMDGNGRPVYRLDYLLVRPSSRWFVRESHLLDTKASDHFPVLAVLELQP